jgi:integrase/recombinase XerD
MEKSILEQYVEHLKCRGFREGSIQHHRLWASRFVDAVGDEQCFLGRLRIEQADAFLSAWLPSLARWTRLLPIAVLRSFLRFLFQRGLVETDLAPMLMNVRLYRSESLPRGIERSQVARVLEQVDRDKSNGARDYAILSLFASYGLRASEILALQVRSVDWTHDLIRVVRPKTCDSLDLPLSPLVGNALLDYLQREWPGDTDELFVFPQRYKGAALRNMVKKYLAKAEVKKHGIATSLFRHSLAMELVKQEVPVKSIADVLGHRHLASTYVYAKSDIERLRRAALPLAGDSQCRYR